MVVTLVVMKIRNKPHKTKKVSFYSCYGHGYYLQLTSIKIMLVCNNTTKKRWETKCLRAAFRILEEDV